MFNKFIKKKISNKKTTNDLYFGCPEAEGESTLNSDIKLDDVFVDIFDVFEKLGKEYFILIGRKGAGKSAYANFLNIKSQDDPEIFCKFITRSDFELEKIVHKLSTLDSKVSYEVFYKWVIYTKFINLLLQDERLKLQPEMAFLGKFMSKHKNLTDVTNFKVDSIKSLEELKIEPEYLKRFFGVSAKLSNEIFKKPTPFYEYIELLEEIIPSILSKSDATRSTFALFFDDLDINFNVDNQENMNSIINLIRITKEINNRIIGKAYPNAKVILLLRDDISEFIKKKGGADTSKVLSSYGITLDWYEGGKKYPKKLKKFVEERIQFTFRKNEISFNENNSWDDLFEGQAFDGGKDSFKYVLDHTFYRPRDLILFLRSVSRLGTEIPVSRYCINQALSSYFVEVMTEVRNEISCLLSNDETDGLVKVLEIISRKNKIGVTYYQFIELLRNEIPEKDSEALAKILFSYSYIFNNDEENGRKYFKYREGVDEGAKYELDLTMNISVHPAIALYFERF